MHKNTHPLKESEPTASANRNQLLKEKMKKIEEKAKGEPDSGRLYRIYASAGNPLDPETYLFVAEFARRKPAEKYAGYIRNKKRYSDKSVLIKEVFAEQPAAAEGELVVVLSPVGEFLPPKKQSGSEPHKPQPPHDRKHKKPGKSKPKTAPADSPAEQ